MDTLAILQRAGDELLHRGADVRAQNEVGEAVELRRIVVDNSQFRGIFLRQRGKAGGGLDARGRVRKTGGPRLPGIKYV